jgi:hypothetical protein
MTSQHTPGPWALDDKTRAVTWGDVSFSAPVGAGGFVIASHTISTIPTYQSDRLTPEHHANARLIAEAPSTLAALEHLLDAMEPPRSRKASEAWDAAHAAVRRARTATD